MQLMIVVALGVGVRLGVLALAPDLEIWADGRNYVFQALAWERFGVYLGSKSFLWPPGYAAVLRMALAWFAEHGILATRLAQIAASAIVGASIVAIGRRVFSDRAAWVAGLLWAIHLPLVAFTHLLRPETFFLAVLAPAVLLFIRVLDSPERDGATALRVCALGLCLGVGALLKQVALLLAPMIVVVLLIDPRQGRITRRLARGTLLLATLLAVLAPWGFRNQEVYDRWVPSGVTVGVNLWWGVNHHYYNLDYAAFDYHGAFRHSSAHRWLVASPSSQPWALSNSMNVVAASDENVASGLAFVRSNPGYYARTRIKKLSDLLTPHSFFVRRFAKGYYPEPLASDGLRQMLVVASVVTSMLILAAAIPGLLAITTWRHMLPFLLLIATVLATVGITSASRYRVPLEPFLIVLAGGFLAGPRVPTGWRRPTLVLGLLVLLGLWAINAGEVLYALRLAM